MSACPSSRRGRGSGNRCRAPLPHHRTQEPRFSSRPPVVKKIGPGRLISPTARILPSCSSGDKYRQWGKVLPRRMVRKPMRTKTYNCPVEAAIEVFGGKWKPLILWWLQQRTWRFAELRRQIPGITEKMLTQQLRELEADGVVDRRGDPTVPPQG